jgi:hypothetical protein
MPGTKVGHLFWDGVNRATAEFPLVFMHLA